MTDPDKHDTATGKWYDNDEVKRQLSQGDILRGMVAESKAGKDTKDKLDPSLVPFNAIEGIVGVREFGNRKYSPDSFYKVPPQQLVDATFRHVMQVLKHEDLMLVDPESGLLHLEHALCSLAGAVEIIKRNS
jgi:hypothetical protein